MSEAKTDWRDDGIRVVRSDQLDLNTPQTPGMSRAAAITHATAGANKLWAGTVTIEPNVKTGAHHHGELESVIYVVSGKARMRWGEELEFFCRSRSGRFYLRSSLCAASGNQRESRAASLVCVSPERPRACCRKPEYSRG